MVFQTSSSKHHYALTYRIQQNYRHFNFPKHIRYPNKHEEDCGVKGLLNILLNGVRRRRKECCPVAIRNLLADGGDCTVNFMLYLFLCILG